MRQISYDACGMNWTFQTMHNCYLSTYLMRAWPMISTRTRIASSDALALSCRTVCRSAPLTLSAVSNQSNGSIRCFLVKRLVGICFSAAYALAPLVYTCTALYTGTGTTQTPYNIYNIGFTTEEEAIALANDSSYGLAANVFSADAARAERVAAQLRAGKVFVNQVYPSLLSLY